MNGNFMSVREEREFDKNISEIPYSQDALVVIITKWDELFFPGEANNLSELLSRIETVWTENYGDVVEGCSMVRRRLSSGRKAPLLVKPFRVPIVGESKGRLNELEYETMRLLEGYLNLVAWKFQSLNS